MTKSIKRMKRLFAWGTALLLVGGMQAALLPVDEPITPVDYVSTLVGTQSKHALSTGNTYPAVAMPWGMNFWTPQTGTMGMDGLILMMPTRFAVSSRHTSPARGLMTTDNSPSCR